jgi:hypothetical protein
LLSREQRRLNGRIGGLKVSATHDPKLYTAPARAAFLATFVRAVDPDGALEPDERARRAEAARRLHFARMAAARHRMRSVERP